MGIYKGLKDLAGMAKDSINARVVQPYIIEKSKEAFKPINQWQGVTRAQLASVLGSSTNRIDEYLGSVIGGLRSTFSFLENNEFLSELETVCNRRLLHMGVHAASEKRLHDANSSGFEELQRIKPSRDAREDEPSDFPLLERQLAKIMNSYRQQDGLPELQLLKNAQFENKKRASLIRSQGPEGLNALPRPALCAVPPVVGQDKEPDELEQEAQTAISQRDQIITHEIPLQLNLFEDDDFNWSDGDPHQLYSKLHEQPEFQAALKDPHMRAVDICVSRTGSQCGVSLILSSAVPNDEELSYEESLADIHSTEDFEADSWEKLMGDDAKEGSEMWCIFNGYESTKDFDPKRLGPKHVPFQSWYSLYCLNSFKKDLGALERGGRRDIQFVNTLMPALSPTQLREFQNRKSNARPELQITISYQALSDKGDQGKALTQQKEELFLKEGTDIVRLKSDSPLLKSPEGEESSGDNGQYLQLSELIRRLKKLSHTRPWKYSGKHETQTEKEERLKKEKIEKDKKAKKAKEEAANSV